MYLYVTKQERQNKFNCARNAETVVDRGKSE